MADRVRQLGARHRPVALDVLVAQAGELFAAVVGSEPFGDDENFFERGGHSLLALQLASRARQMFNVDVPVRAVFVAPTPRLFAGLLSQYIREAWDAVEPGHTMTDGVASSAQKRMWSLAEMFDEPCAYTVPVLFRVTGAADWQALEHALQDVVARHEVLRTRYRPERGELWQDVLTVDECRTDLELQRLKQGCEAEVLSEIARHRFDLAAEIPIRAWAWARGFDGGLAILFHHIAVDEISVGIVLRDLSVAYSARTNHTPPRWRRPAERYSAFASQERTVSEEAHGRGADGSSRLERVVDVLKRSTEGGCWPGCRAMELSERPSQRELRAQIDDALCQALVARARAWGVTPHIVVMAAVSVAVVARKASSIAMIATPVSVRGQRWLEDAVGLFVNTVVVVSDLGGNLTWREAVERVMSASAEAYSQQEIPYDAVVRALREGRPRTWQEPFDVMVVNDSGASADLNLPGLKCQRIEIPATIARLPVTVSADLAPRASRKDDTRNVTVAYAERQIPPEEAVLFHRATVGNLCAIALSPEREVSLRADGVSVDERKKS